jgi:hypothetical protein
VTRIRGWRDRLEAPYNRYFATGEPPVADITQALGDNFMADVFGRKPHILHWRPPAVDDIVGAALQVIATIEVARVIVVDQDGRRQRTPEEVLQERVEKQLVVAQDVHTHLTLAAELRQLFLGLFRCPVTTGLYVNGVGAPGFEEHHDAHHVFAWQLAGTKEWSLGPAKVAYPHRRFQHDLPEETLDSTMIVTAGQALYLPPGVRHKARAVGGTSVHLTMGVHTPRIIDAIEALVETYAWYQASLRAPIPFRNGTYEVSAPRLAATFTAMSRSMGDAEISIRGGTSVAVAPEAPPLVGEWPISAGYFQPQAPKADAPGLVELAEGLVEAMPGLSSVYLRGSAFSESGPTPISDTDLILVFKLAPTSDDVAVARTWLSQADDQRRWDIRPTNLQAVTEGTADSYTVLTLAVASLRLAGVSPWSSPPPVPASRGVAAALFLATQSAWAKAPLNAVGWRQRRALRLVGIQWLALRGRFTRHPADCAALCAHLHPDLAANAALVCEDLFAGNEDDPASARATALGDELLLRGLPLRR